jgi:hypothetical protein
MPDVKQLSSLPVTSVEFEMLLNFAVCCEIFSMVLMCFALLEIQVVY